ncbi:LysR family transcriptional regulator [Aestuariibius sp. 2305UL40-4]|uniref:LysR family transcriptional regulator n=1 Tax=Aestuariibius violaceus TaxID=3234132 RepID=UPI00345E6BFF
MPRNLDMTALRSFVTVAEAGGVTRAAGILNLTQSAVSMQLKRLEEALGLSLLDRSSRAIALTSAGEQLKSYAQRMLVLNDEIWGKLTATEYEGELSLGVPHDIIYPNVPKILKKFAAEFPRMQVRLVSAPTRALKAMFARGECDMILTTEDRPDADGESLIELDLVWIGAMGGTAWHERPLPVAFCSNCIFRPDVIRALDKAGIDWDMIVESELDNAVEAAVSADLAVHAAVPDNLPPQTERIDHGGVLPALGTTQVNLYHQRPDDPVHGALAEIVRSAYRNG